MNNYTFDFSKKNYKKKSNYTQLFSNVMNYDFSFAKNGIPDHIKEQLYYELSVLVESGVDLKSALELFISGISKERHINIFRKLSELIINGKSMSDAMKDMKLFSAYEYYSVQIGEETGKIVYVFKQLAQFYKNKIIQRRQIITASTYPSIIIITAFSAIVFMLNFIVPMFADIFTKSGNELPSMTKFVLKLSVWFGNYYLLIFIIFIVLIVAYQLVKKRNKVRKMVSTVLMNIPVVGDIISKIYLARFSYSMALLISSRVPMLKALTLTSRMIEFYPLEVALITMEKDILNGKALYKCLADYKIFPPRMVALVKAGEDVNTLDTFFLKIAEQLSNDINHKISVLSSLIEPIIILFLGLVVGVILIAMYLPIFNMSTLF